MRYTEWTSSIERPHVAENFGNFSHSIDVLITDGRIMFVGYLETWEDDEYPPQWKQKGKDGYDANGITHWMILPDPPPKG